jgi:hypothetical protein
VTEYRFPYFRADGNGNPVLQEIVVEADTFEEAMLLAKEELDRRA